MCRNYSRKYFGVNSSEAQSTQCCGCQFVTIAHTCIILLWQWSPVSSNYSTTMWLLLSGLGLQCGLVRRLDGPWWSGVWTYARRRDTYLIHHAHHADDDNLGASERHVMNHAERAIQRQTDRRTGCWRWVRRQTADKFRRILLVISRRIYTNHSDLTSPWRPYERVRYRRSPSFIFLLSCNFLFAMSRIHVVVNKT